MENKSLHTPSNVDAERLCLGMILRNRDGFEIANTLLQSDDFFMTPHVYIWTAMETIFNDGGTISVITLVETIKSQNHWQDVGGDWSAEEYITNLTDCPEGSIKEFAEIVRSKSLLRKVLVLAKHAELTALRDGADGDPVVREIEASLQSLCGVRLESKVYQIPSLVADAALRASQRQERASTSTGQSFVTGLSTGFDTLDYLTLGLQPKNLIILAALPGTGKSAWSLQIADHVATELKRTAVIFSLEMGREQLVDRLLVYHTQIDAQRWNSGLIRPEEWDRVKEVERELQESMLFISDSVNATVGEIWNQCRKMVLRHGLSLVVIDYLQLMSTPSRGQNRNTEITEISRGLKNMANELEISVILLSQLNRGIESRADKRPGLQDLRDSSEIGAAADLVTFLYKDDRKDEASSDVLSIVNVYIAKHRSGPTGEFQLGFHNGLAKFVELDHRHAESYETSYTKAETVVGTKPIGREENGGMSKDMDDFFKGF